MAQDMETFAARLATFDLVLHPETRRTSGTKSTKPISWPHSRPSPAELAHAGFFYNPYETNPDNTTCFQCRRALDGWEENDNPITEHLKHSRDCGWAIMMDIQQHSSNPAEIEDPTSERITQARQTTFGELWPYDGKRGWVCQSEKMVEGGWYFCPNEESVDLASCPYCKLSLDGWEPKDDPFDEHYRRSADCSFFVFAKPPTAKGKGSRSKKGRTSKTSRLSTQSTLSEVQASDIEDSMDQSLQSQPTKAKSTKKSSKSKSKSSKSKKDEVAETGSQMDVDEVEQIQEPPKTQRNTRGKKRLSSELDKDTMSIADSDIVEQQEPPVKKRAIKSRTSTQQGRASNTSEAIVETQEERENSPEQGDQKTSRGATKKKTSGRGRKASGTLSTSKSTTKSQIPRDSELDAAIEAGLETDEFEYRHINDEINEKAAAKPPAKKTKSKKKTTKKDAELSDSTASHSREIEAHAIQDPEPDQRMLDIEEVPVQQKPKSIEKKPKKQNSRNSNSKSREQTAEANELNDQHHESFVSVEIISRPPEQYSNDTEQNDKGAKKKVKKKASSEKTKKTKIAENDKNEETRDETRDDLEDRNFQDAQVDTPRKSKQEDPTKRTPDDGSNRRRSRVPPKTAERYSDIPQEKQFAKSLAESREPGLDQSPELNSAEKETERQETISPLPSMSRGTPSLSPQSSDAENQPPSLKPSTSRALPSSPSKPQAVRIPLATSTPSPSKQNSQPRKLVTSHPWGPIDIDEILVAGTSDRENLEFHAALNSAKGDLTSPEKKMTVEEWIMWNAKNGEERLKRECERLVGQFEREGARAIRALEGIECID